MSRPSPSNFPNAYWRTPCTCGFIAKTAEEWQRHGILYQGCGKDSSPFKRQRGKRKPNDSSLAMANNQ
jgi:hypothetical protein